MELPLHLELGLSEEAARQCVAGDACALQLLDSHLPPPQATPDLVALIQSWIDADDGGEQAATGDFLVHALDEDRLSQRRLFPPELEGVSW